MKPGELGLENREQNVVFNNSSMTKYNVREKKKVALTQRLFKIIHLTRKFQIFSFTVNLIKHHLPGSSFLVKQLSIVLMVTISLINRSVVFKR